MHSRTSFAVDFVGAGENPVAAPSFAADPAADLGRDHADSVQPNLVADSERGRAGCPSNGVVSHFDCCHADAEHVAEHAAGRVVVRAAADAK